MSTPSPWPMRVASLSSRVARKARHVARSVGQEGGEDDLAQEALLVLLESSPFRQTSRGEYLSRLDDGALCGWACWQAASALRVRACYDLDDATPAPAANLDTCLDIRAAVATLDTEARSVALRLAAGEAATEGATVAEQKRASRARARVRAALRAAV
jgi:hypothetical protein